MHNLDRGTNEYYGDENDLQPRYNGYWIEDEEGPVEPEPDRPCDYE